MVATNKTRTTTVNKNNEKECRKKSETFHYSTDNELEKEKEISREKRPNKKKFLHLLLC